MTWMEIFSLIVAVIAGVIIGPVWLINSRKSIRSNKWEWKGSAGHLKVWKDCLFHLHTKIGDWTVSTIGEYYPERPLNEKWEMEEIGIKRHYETFVFDSRMNIIDTYGVEKTEIKTYVQCQIEAERNHIEACKHYSKRRSRRP